MPTDAIANAWKADFRAQLSRDCDSGRWGIALMLMGWIHLCMFLACHLTHSIAVKSNRWHAAFWVMDLIGGLLVARVVAGKTWHRSSATGLILGIWMTFFLLALNIVSLNSITGLDHDWFKPTWATLSTFGFSTMAWLVDRKFLIPALQMYATGLLMAWQPHAAYLIYGLSWWSILQYVGLSLERRRLTSFRPIHLRSRDRQVAEFEGDFGGHRRDAVVAQSRG